MTDETERPDVIPAEENEAAASDAEASVSAEMPETTEAPAVDYEAKAAEMEDKYLRCRAEYENYRKRMAREFCETRDQARLTTIRDFLTVYDYFAMGMSSIDTAPNLEILKQGMTMIWNEFGKVLDGLGVKAVESLGKPFDVSLHEAVSREASETVPEGVVLREWKKAFMLGERLLRPAVVVVSSGPAVPEEPADERHEDEPKPGNEA